LYELHKIPAVSRPIAVVFLRLTMARHGHIRAWSVFMYCLHNVLRESLLAMSRI